MEVLDANFAGVCLFVVGLGYATPFERHCLALSLDFHVVAGECIECVTYVQQSLFGTESDFCKKKKSCFVWNLVPVRGCGLVACWLCHFTLC